MKVLLLADQKVGVEVFKYFCDTYPNDIGLIVVTEQNDLFNFAQSKNIPVKIWSKTETFEDMSFDLGILAWWPHIVKAPLISLPKHGFINFHPSYLPHNRGKHYNFWALVEKCPFGVSIHKVDPGIDTGDIVSQRQIEYDWEDNGETLYHKAQNEIVDLFKSTYPLIRERNIVGKKQKLEEGSFHLASELNSASKIDLNATFVARDLLNLLRARTFSGHPGCWFLDKDNQEYEVTVQIKKRP